MIPRYWKRGGGVYEESRDRLHLPIWNDRRRPCVVKMVVGEREMTNKAEATKQKLPRGQEASSQLIGRNGSEDGLPRLGWWLCWSTSQSRSSALPLKYDVFDLLLQMREEDSSSHPPTLRTASGEPLRDPPYPACIATVDGSA